MPARIAIRRLQIHGLAPRDHPAPDDLKQRLMDAARSFLPEALEQAVTSWSGDAVLRIRRLSVDIALDTTFEPRAFAALLGRAITRELRRAEAGATMGGGSDGVVCYPSRAIYLAALLEALTERRAAHCWWLRDEEGLRFLSPAAAIRTALLADARVGLEALASLRPSSRMALLRALTPGEADRLLDGLAGAGVATVGFQDCITAAADAVAELPPDDVSALAIFLGAFVRRPGLAGPALAATARLWVAMTHALRADLSEEAESDMVRRLDNAPDAAAAVPEPARRLLAEEVVADHLRSARPHPDYCFTQFGGLLLLLPNLPMAEIARVVADWPDAPPDTAALVGYAALGLCAGRERFAQWLGDVLWRELFGLDVQAPAAALTARLAVIPAEAWATLAPLGAPLDRRRDARFLLAPRGLVGSRAAAHTLAGLARAASSGFARRLAGFGAASAPFLWANVLATTAVLERRPGGWSARLSRPPLDVLLSLSRIAEGSVTAPSGVRVDLARVAT
jgi:hypothetical protein